MSNLYWSFMACIAALLVGGCDNSDDAPKASHFEHDHAVAAHWPSDLNDAAAKLRDRLQWLADGQLPERHTHEQEGSDGHEEHQHDEDGHDEHGHDEHGHHDDHDHELDPAAEIFEIVSWVPEIAADTDLSESDWVPIYDASEALIARLGDPGEELTTENRGEVEVFCQLIETTARKIPKQFTPSRGTSP